MILFDQTDIFTTGTAGRKIFDLPDLELMQYDGFIPKAHADSYYTILLSNTPWQEYQMPMYDKMVTAPRMIAWYGEQEEAGETALPWTPELLELRDQVQQETGLRFNAVLLNLYRNGNDSVAWHSDREHKIGKNPNIASVTFGQTRPFRFRHKNNKEVGQLEIPLHHGTLLLMSGTTNTFWEHHIPKSAKNMLPRINLTFRQVRNNGNSNGLK
ncbi:alpha-ketoglutarate-dependent dioxygenase AlkB [Flavobacterium sp. J372]|jgi:alkylated DNA repair dioxygenase AlkB|uniref:alpha-ketoglutarate-dependent dioxygenase AlkB family protein n=1 Tax=Flavobacterium sp. J372 TaxID=2898436 RepID=UPI0021519E7D|nr:alpha-ketoglutarate-dependent dioxygenase AlkB [Flavobacterium sp. J372]MCR5862558.1 alpha-ketoglutarate-dependent dioxygenase AlkB [Flavobacterium sp. J372]MDC7218215.1 alpha-ketoglutarate-dependent dioxygenase AlkB [Spirochaetales bacterium]